MRAFDILILLFCCLCWAGNFVVSAWALGNNPVPPFMLAAVRAAIVLLFMFVFLRPPLPERFGMLLIVCACVGPIHLGFLYTGLQTAPASGSSIVSQLLIPFATILSMIFLKEKVGWVRGLGILGAFMGTMIMIYEPGALTFDIGLIYIVAAYFSLAVGSIVMKKVGNIAWQQYVVWMAVTVGVVMTIASLVFETGQGEAWRTSKGPLLIAAGYAAVMVSAIAHGQYFNMIKRYDVSVVVPITLMVPVFATILGIWLLDETLTKQMLVGAALILPCVYIIARRQNIAPLRED